MSFYLNPFGSDFNGTWIIHDSTDDVAFVCRGNRQRNGLSITSTASHPYNLSGVDAESVNKCLLTLYLTRQHRAWQKIQVDLSDDSGVDFTVNLSSVTAQQIADLLNSSSPFSEFCSALASNGRVVITAKGDIPQDFYIDLNGAETVLKFNGYASIVEMPSAFQRYSLTPLTGQRSSDRQLLLLLDTTDLNHQALITAAGLSYSSPKPDWQLLNGRSDYFKFTKKISATETLQYPAGSIPGDIGTRTVTDGSGNVFVMPHTLTSSDLITPP